MVQFSILSFNVTFTDCTFENNLKTAIKALGSNLVSYSMQPHLQK